MFGMRHTTTTPLALLVGLLLLCARPAAAQTSLTVYGGYRGGGNFQQTASPNTTLELKSAAAASVSLDWVIDASRQVEVFASRQATEIPASVTGTISPVVPLTVSYLHLGGTNFFEGTVGRGPYVVGGLGITYLAPGLPGLSAEVRPSMNVGLGYQLPLASSLALRFEVRGYITLVNSSANLFCSGGCVLSIKGDGLTQGEAMLGLAYSF
jgi:hypothetical protein